jgi:DnaK suppressor protein
MTKNELKKFRDILQARQTELESTTGKREALAVDTSPEELDRIQNAAERDLAIGALERESSRLHEVRAALGRIREGTFGTCADCEEEISPKRLAAVPWTRSCIVCQEAADRECAEPWNATGESFVEDAA